MSTYFIGDVHGCYETLQRLLAQIHYQPEQDHLWFAGDLVNKGPESLRCMQLILSLPHANSVLGNHDLHLLALASDMLPHHKSHNMHDIIESADRDRIIEWLRHRPLLYTHPQGTLVHAGLYPTWTLAESQGYAQEVEKVLQGDTWRDLLANLYGNTPADWQENYTGWDRYRAIINIFTRMRFVDNQYTLDFSETGRETRQPQRAPWYQYCAIATPTCPVYFGHWAALQGNSQHPHYISIDGGCVWGGRLLAIRIDDSQGFSQHQIDL
jgi:bis(5'-nucleosyl)-tetraphosphatase (symmetrical)